MDKCLFLDRIVDILKQKYKIKAEPIAKTFSPNVQKINGSWIERDRAFMYSPPGWLKPNNMISMKHKIWTTGHHIGDSYHEYNSMESAIQNAIKLIGSIEPCYSQTITQPWRISTFVWFIIVSSILVYLVYSKYKI